MKPLSGWDKEGKTLDMPKWKQCDQIWRFLGFGQHLKTFGNN